MKYETNIRTEQSSRTLSFYNEQLMTCASSQAIIACTVKILHSLAPSHLNIRHFCQRVRAGLESDMPIRENVRVCSFGSRDDSRQPCSQTEVVTFYDRFYDPGVRFPTLADCNFFSRFAKNNQAKLTCTPIADIVGLLLFYSWRVGPCLISNDSTNKHFFDRQVQPLFISLLVRTLH